jgi:hypothetical protein
MKVYKYPLELCARQTIHMPKGARILSVQVQRERICMWALIDPYAANEEREFYVVGTGQLLSEMPPPLEFLATVQMDRGALVWHVFAEPSA